MRNINVVCALRALESQSLSEQVLGRGLRLPFGQRTGRQMLDTVEVLSHRKFRDLLNDAGTLLEAFFTDRHPAQLVAPDSTGTLDGEAALATGAESGRLDVFVRPTEGVDASGEPVRADCSGRRWRTSSGASPRPSREVLHSRFVESTRHELPTRQRPLPLDARYIY